MTTSADLGNPRFDHVSDAAASEVASPREGNAQELANDSSARRQLFRQEALNARSSDRLGSVTLAQPIANDVAAAAAALIITAICCFAWFGTYTRKATVSGVLSPGEGVLRVVAPSPGLVTDVLVKEGQIVAAGKSLFVLSGERISNSGATQSSIGEQLNKRHTLLLKNSRLAEERHAERLRGSDDRLRAIDSELNQIAVEAALLDGRERLGQAHVRRQEESVRTGYISQAAFDLARSELMALQGQKHALARSRAALDRDRASLHATRREATLQFRSEASEVEASIALLFQEVSENNARAVQVVKAPFAATVSGLATQAGRHVTSATVLTTLIPTGVPLVAHLYAVSGQTGFIETGQSVSMRYHAFPYQKFGMARGKVLAITRSPYAPQELPAHVASILGSNGASPVYQILVELSGQTVHAYGSQYALATGMTVEADIFLDQRRLYEWMLEPISAVTRKISVRL